jgi:hypothetical protein
MFLAISRLTDRDRGKDENLSYWVLLPAISEARDPGFGLRMTEATTALEIAAANIRQHRNKRLAHFDLDVSLQVEALPPVTFKEIRMVISQMQNLLNEFHQEFGNHTMYFDALVQQGETGQAELTVLKAFAYDQIETEGVVQNGDWRYRAKRAGYI